MKYLAILTVVFIFAGCSCSDESATKKVTKKVVSTAVSTGKDAISGIKEGIDEGRKEGESADDAIILSTNEDIAKNINFSIEAVVKTGTTYAVSMVFKNDNDRSVRITKLDNLGNIVLLDAEGFATPLPSLSHSGSVTVLPKSATRYELKFYNVAGKPAKLRFFSVDYDLPEVTVTETAESKAN